MAERDVSTHPVFEHRETCLQAATARLRSLFGEAGAELPSVRCSCSFAFGAGANVLGQCWSAELTFDRRAQIAISPFVDDSLEVLGILAHELVHACAPGAGHGRRFRELAVAVGLEGPMRSTRPTLALQAQLEDMVLELGAYPHVRVDLKRLRELAPPTAPGATGPADAPRDQRGNSRLIKASCEGCGYPARVTRKWLSKLGPPICPCGRTMSVTDSSPVARALLGSAVAASKEVVADEVD